MSKQVNDIMVKTKNASKFEKQKNREARDKKRAAALEAKSKARDEAKEKGLPWNDNIPAARFLENYDAAFMSAVAGEPKVDVVPPEANVVCGVNQDPEANVPQEETKTAAQLTMEAAKQAMLGTANDNEQEEIEPVTTTGLPVVTGEVLEPVQASDNPSTWIVDTNGGLVRLPGESNKKYSNRKHKYKQWKRTLTVVDETRNGDAPTKSYPTGELVYNSDQDGQTLPVVEKSAAESATVFEAIVETANESANEAPVEEQVQSDAPQEAPQTEPVQETTVEETSVAKPETSKPTLTLASSQNEKPETIEGAKKFYGDTWTAERADKLTKAYKFLMLAIRTQEAQKTDPSITDARVSLPLTSALRLETEALGISVPIAKAA